MLKTFFLSLFTGIWGYVAIGGLAFTIGLSGALYFDGIRYGNRIANIELLYEKQRSADISSALAKLTGFIGKIDTASVEYQAMVNRTNDQFSKLETELQNAKTVPLPVDCKPDAGRMRIFNAAIASANGNNSPTR